MAARRKRWRLRRMAIGASAGPSSAISSSLRQAAERRDLPALALRHRMRGARERAGVRFRRALVFAGDDDRGEPPERRQAADAPLLGLLAVEALGVAGNERGDHRMVRLPGLQQRASRRARRVRRAPSPDAGAGRCARRRAGRRWRGRRRRRPRRRRSGAENCGPSPRAACR